MIPDNAWILRITAAAGTELADPYSYSTVKLVHEPVFLPVQKQFTIHRTVILHAAWLDQACAHCPIFLTAASRRSLVRVSVPVWGISLSGPLHRSLGKPLPYQLANGTHAHLLPL